MEIEGSHPFQLALSYEEGEIYIVDVAGRPHNLITGCFATAFIIALLSKYGRTFYSSWENPLQLDDYFYVPDFSFQITSSQLADSNSSDVSIVGEIAISQNTNSILRKCANYFAIFDVDVAICVDMEESLCNPSVEHMTRSKISRSNDVNFEKTLKLYIFYSEEIPYPITVPFDKEFSFKIKKSSIERKLRESAKQQDNNDFIEIKVNLESIIVFKTQ